MKLDNWTFRIRCIPPNIERWSLPDFLLAFIPGLNSVTDLEVGSFAPSVDSFTQPPTHTATVRFKTVPLQFKNGSSEWSIRMPGQTENLILDTSFNDFTPLNAITPDLHKFDCIAISGLASHPFGSWKNRSISKEDDDFMWLRDRLPTDQPSFRVMLYGYDSKLFNSQSFQTIDDLALRFATRLVTLRSLGDLRKPIVLLAHSLGGIILKRVFLYLAGGTDIDRYTLKAVRAAVLFGAPNKGMQTQHLRAMVEDQPNQQLVDSLSTESQYLKELATNFRNISGLQSIRLIVAYETVRSPTVVKNSEGKWERSGPHEILVPRESAIIQTSDVQSDDVFPIDEDHSNMVKFSDNDHNYRTVVAAVERAIKAFTVEPANFQGSSPFHAPDRRFSAAIQSYFVLQERKKPTKPDDIIQVDDWKELLQSLDFDEMSFRRDDITEPQSDTFGWIFEKDSLHFIQWLESQEGLYWIRGKAGAGKSTLMKYLYGNRRVSDILRHHLGEYETITIWHFFHQRGSVLQKSYEGLLRSILFGLTKDNKHLANEVFDVFVQPETRIWDTSKLEMALRKVLTQKKVRVTVTIFVDALDEYYGAPEVIARVMKTFEAQPLDAWTRVKVCFSSRPWDVFVQQFSDSPGFQIQDQTQDDVRKYVYNRVSDMPGLEAMLLTDGRKEESYEFFERIVQRAEGVFLWVRLVLDHMESEIQTKRVAGLPDLEKLLSVLPGELNDHYRRTIERIPSESRYQAFILLEILHRSTSITWLDELFYASACAQGSTFEDSLDRLQKTIKQHISESEMSRQLLNLCGGLIEVLPGSRQRVQYIHRTVKDFVASPEVKEMIVGRAYKFRLSSENGTTYLAKYWLTRNALVGDVRKQDVLKPLEYACLSESTTGVHLGSFLDSMHPAVFSEWKSYAFTITDPIHAPYVFAPSEDLRICDSPMTFAICADLKLYLEDRLRNCSSVDSLSRPEHIPILHCAVARLFNGYDGLFSAQARAQHFVYVVKAIFDLKPDLNLTYQRSSAFQLLFTTTRLQSFNNAFIQLDPLATAILDIFLANGQDPNISLKAHINIGETMISTPLHLSWSLAPRLLKAGANPNALDSAGQTPLDYWIINFVKDTQHASDHTIFLKVMILLIQSGGLMSKHGNDFHRRFLTKASGGSLRGGSLPPELKNPPLLRGRGLSRFLSKFGS